MSEMILQGIGIMLPASEDKSAIDISFIIPAFNEEAVIAATLATIREHVGENNSYEIILVDHGSTDRTVEIARNAGVHVLDSRMNTIAANRNYGASQSSGKVLVFLDADVRLTVDWERYIGRTLHSLEENEKIITGSHCGISEQPGWIERCWFQPLALEVDSRHIGTGHLLVRRDFFDNVGGFDENLETGEDYEFCSRARQKGAVIFNCPELRVIHEGFPNDLSSFMRREAWHGLGDLRSIEVFFRSKVAMGSCLFVVFHVLMLGGLLFDSGGEYRSVSYSGAAAILLLLIASVIVKYPHIGIKGKLCALYLFYFYYWGRAWSCIKAVRRTLLA